MPARIVPAKHAPAWVALVAAGMVAAGSPGVANAYPGAGSQWDQDGSSHGYAEAIGAALVPPKWPQNLLFGSTTPKGIYGAVATPVIDSENRGSTGILASTMPISMPSGRMAPAPKIAATGGPTAAPQGGQSTSTAEPSKPIVPVGAQ